MIHRLAEDINHNGTFDMWASTKDSNGVYGDSNGVDEDSNGYTDDVIGIKCLANGQYSPDVRQYQSWPINVGRPLAHGTNVAGFVAARTNNVEGGAGMAGGWGALPGVRIMVVTMEVQSSVFPDVAVQNAVEYATNAGADIISMS
ncbi:MAG: S8 family serine peptidase [candidate division Zixibacteria bacterium]|nr:S8 family serine peptidase [candidate division Zixibacteria bacterium]